MSLINRSIHKYYRVIALGVAVAMGWACSVRVARAEDTTGPDLIEILRQADAATRRVRALSYDVELYGTGSAADRVTHIRGHVDARQARHGIQGAFRLGDLHKRNSSGDAFRFYGKFEARGFTRRFDVATTGEKFIKLDFGRRLYVEGGSDAEELVKHFRPLFMLEYFHPTPFSDEINGKARTYLGTKRIGDVECHVIDVVYGRKGVDARWYFGVEDSLPRRVERKIMAGDEVVGATVLELKNLNTSPAFDRETFVPAMPDGFERRGYAASNSKLLPVGTTAPDFELPRSDGELVRLQDLKGRVVVLEFWASWCKPCKLVMPHVQAIHEQFGNSGVNVFAINCFESIDEPSAELAKLGATYPCLVKGESVAERFNVRSIPAIYVIGPDGKVVYTRAGYESGFEREFAEAIKGALQKSQMQQRSFILTNQR